MVLPTDPVDRIVGRLSELQPDGLDVNLACYAPVVRKIDACSRLYENLPALKTVLEAMRRHWPGLLTVKIRLGHATIGAEDRFIERLRVIEDCGVDAITLHVRFFEDKFKRRARHELFSWASSLTRLPIIANGDITSAKMLRENEELFQSVSGVMVGRMAIAQPWIFAAWNRPVQVDYREVWHRLHAYVCEDFPAVTALRRIKLFTKYYARNFVFGHNFNTSVSNAPTLDAARERADAFFDVSMDTHAEPSLMGL
jgi:tRNA-dihydrouridine synthase